MATACGLLASAAQAANTITLSTNIPSGNILVSQLTDIGNGTQDGARDFTDNGGPVGQTFLAPVDGLISGVSVKGRGNSGGTATTGGATFGLLFGPVNPVTGQFLSSSIRTVSGTTIPANTASWLTFNLDLPLTISAGVTYGFSIAQWSTATGMFNNAGWFGLAHSVSDVYTGGYAFNLNTSAANPGGNAGAPRFGFTWPGSTGTNNFLGYAAANPVSYDYSFALQGTVIPEPTTLCLFGLGGVALLCAFRRTRP